MTSLALCNVSLSYAPDVLALDGVDLTVGRGERLVLLGPSGGGKTTTLRLIAGLLAPTAGDIRFDGRSVLGTPPERRGAAMVFQQHTLFPFRTVGENVAYGLRIRRVAKPSRRALVAEALRSVHLAGFEDRWPGQLSGGQRQRVALARALVIEPEILLLDEPLSSLDPELRGDLQRTIADVQRSAGITTVIVTHDRAEAWALADRVAVLIDGRLHQIGTPDDVATNPVDADVTRVFGTP